MHDTLSVFIFSLSYSLPVAHSLTHSLTHSLSLSLSHTHRCPLTADGDNNMESGIVFKTDLKFQNNPLATFAQFGYTEYLELEYENKVYGKSTHQSVI